MLDQFCALFDDLLGRTSQVDLAMLLLQEQRLEDDLVTAIRNGDPLPADQPADDPEAARWLWAIDAAAEQVNRMINPSAPRAVPAPWNHYLRSYDDEGWLYRDGDGGGVLPVAAHRKEPTLDPFDLFSNLRRVPAAEAAGVDLKVIRPLVQSHDEGQLWVGTFTLVNRADLRIRTRAEAEVEWYWVEVQVDDDDLRQRVRAVLRALDDEGCEIGLGPEAVVGPGCEQIWADEIRARPGRRAGTLRYVMIGTGYQDHDEDGRPRQNRAIVLNAVTGRRVVDQTKRASFGVYAGDLAVWGHGDVVTGHLPGDMLHESIHPDGTLTLLDVPPRRIAILICEDLARIDLHLHQLARLGANTLLCPVLSRDLHVTRKRYGWEAQAAKVHTRFTGAEVVVANSRGLPGKLPRVVSFSVTPPERRSGATPASDRSSTSEEVRRDGPIVCRAMGRDVVEVHVLPGFRGRDR